MSTNSHCFDCKDCRNCFGCVCCVRCDNLSYRMFYVDNKPVMPDDVVFVKYFNKYWSYFTMVPQLSFVNKRGAQIALQIYKKDFNQLESDREKLTEHHKKICLLRGKRSE